MMNNNYWDLPQFKKTKKTEPSKKAINLLQIKIFANIVKKG